MNIANCIVLTGYGPLYENLRIALVLVCSTTGLAWIWPILRWILVAYHDQWVQNSSLVPVPAAYNDLTADREQRDHVGWVWYQREYLWSDILRRDPSTRIFLRFGSVQYHAVVVGFFQSIRMVNWTSYLVFERGKADRTYWRALTLWSWTHIVKIFYEFDYSSG